MKYRLIVFALALAAGVGLSSSEEISGKIDDYFHHDCVRYSDYYLEKSFTMKEIEPFLGKKVHFKNSKLHSENTGRAVMMYIVGYDKFLLAVDWKIDPEKGEEYLLLYGKDDLPNLELDN